MRIVNLLITGILLLWFIGSWTYYLAARITPVKIKEFDTMIIISTDGYGKYKSGDCVEDIWGNTRCIVFTTMSTIYRFGEVLKPDAKYYTNCKFEREYPHIIIAESGGKYMRESKIKGYAKGCVECEVLKSTLWEDLK